MSTERLTFKGGWWADIRQQWPYGADTKIAGAWGFTDDPEAFENASRVTLQQSVTDAHVPDIDGNAIPFGPDAWETCDGRIGRAILKKCRLNWAAWQKGADPNASAETSSGSP